MSHQFKRSKPLGKNRQSMKSKGAESPIPLPMAQDSADDAVYDFLYVRIRISTLYAQLYPQGTLTSVKTTAQTGFSEDHNVGSDLKILKADIKSGDTGSEGIEHTFDAAWSIPLEVLEGLRQRSIVNRTIKSSYLGSILLLDVFMRIIDYATIRDLWEPSIKMLPDDQRPVNVDNAVALIKGLPQTIHAHFLTDGGFLWSSLDASDLMVPTNDIVLKHGGSISGEWKLLCLLDAFPADFSVPDFEHWTAGPATDGVLTAMHAVRMQIGRPAQWFGVTPLLIYRHIGPYRPQSSLGRPTSS